MSINANTRSWAMLVAIFSTLLGVLTLFSDALGISETPGIGWSQGILSGLCLFVAACAWIFWHSGSSVWGSVLVASLTVGFALFVAEMGLRVYTYLHPAWVWTEMVQPSECCYYENIPRLVMRGFLGETISNNQGGWRDDREYGLEHVPGTVRVAFVGDSMTFGLGLPLEETYWKKTAARIQGNYLSDIQIEPLNFGIPGTNTRIQAKHFFHRIMSFNPDIVVLQVFPDVFGEMSVGLAVQLEQEQRRRAMAEQSLFRTLLSFRGLQLAALIRNAVDAWRKSGERADPWLASVEGRLEYFSEYASWFLDYLKGNIPHDQQAGMKNDVLSMVMSARTRHIGVVILFVPDVVQLGRPELQQVNTIFQRIADEAGVSFLDVTREFEKVQSQGKHLYLLPRDAHINATATNVIAEMLSPLLISEIPARLHVTEPRSSLR